MDYKYIQMWGEMLQSFQSYIDAEKAKAAEDNAPFNAIYKRDGKWITFDTVSNEEVISYFSVRGLNH